MSLIYRIYCSIIPLALAGCLISTPPAIGPGESEEIHGAAGHWVPVKSGDHRYMRVNADGSMNTGSKPDKLNTIYRTAWLNEHAFVIEQVVEREDGLVQGVMELAHFVPGYLVVYSAIDKAIYKQAAKQTGLRLHPLENELHIVAGQPKSLVLETFAVLERLVIPGDGYIYKRQGPYVQPGENGKSMANVRKLLDKAQIKPAVEMAGFLSDRGDLQAQATLMELVKLKQLDRHEGIHHGLRLARNIDDRPIDFFNLAVLYASASAGDPKQADLEKGLYWMTKAFYLHPGSELGDWLKTLEKLVCVQEQALLRACARAKHDEILRSIDTQKAIKRMIELTAKKHEKSSPSHP